MAKVQSDFYQKWRSTSIEATYTTNQTLNDVIEYVEVDTTSNAVDIALPDTTSSNIANGKRIWIYDAGNAATNYVRVIPNGSDSSTIEGLTEVFIEQDNGAIVFEFLDNQWVIIATSAGGENKKSYGGFYLAENTTVTTIAATDTYTEIGGVGVAFPVNLFSFTTSPNVVTYKGNGDIVAEVTANISLRRDSGGGFRDYRVALFKDGVEQAGFSAISSERDRESCLGFTGNLGLAKDEALDIRVKNETNTNNVLITDLSLSVKQI